MKRDFSSLPPRQQALILAEQYSYLPDPTTIRAHIIREVNYYLPLDTIRARQELRRRGKRCDRRTFKPVNRDHADDEYESRLMIDNADAASAMMAERLAGYRGAIA